MHRSALAPATQSRPGLDGAPPRRLPAGHDRIRFAATGLSAPAEIALLAKARIRMETLEYGAGILLAAHGLGRVNRLTPDQMHDLERLRGMSRHGQSDLGY